MLAALLCHLPVAVDRSLEELHRILRLSEFPIGGFDLQADAAHAGVALEGVGPALGLLVHHLQHVSSTLLRGGQLLKQTHARYIGAHLCYASNICASNSELR